MDYTPHGKSYLGKGNDIFDNIDTMHISKDADIHITKTKKTLVLKDTYVCQKATTKGGAIDVPSK